MMIELPYRADRDNPNWPLPADYYELAPEDQRAIRLAILKTQGTPEDFLVAFLFFEAYYLVDYNIHDPDSGGIETPFFDDYVPNAPFHLEALKDFHKYEHNVLGAPRGGAKSVKLAMELPLFLLVTRANYGVSICSSTDRMIAKLFDKVRKQIELNERIKEDWGELKPVRGHGLWSHHQITTMNGAWMEGFSVTGRKRGARPNLFILDDPEYDPEKSTDTQSLREQFDRTLFRQIIPMLRPGCKLFWLGTTIDRRGFLYHALKGDDPRFTHWNRRRVKAFEQAPDGTITLCWPEMWTYEWLMHQKAMMGPSAFSAEYLNEPVAEEDRIFSVHPLYDAYEIDGDIEPCPANSQAVIRYYKLPTRFSTEDPTGIEIVTMSLSEFLKKMPNIIMCVDYASTVTQTSDYSCIGILGFTSDLNMWALDLWHGKVSDNVLVQLIWKYGSKWFPRVVACESQSLLDLLQVRMDEFLLSGADSGWRPRPLLLRYGGRGAPSKAQRIKSEEWRFTRHLIKLPLSLRANPMWSVLFQQIEDFTENLNLLEHDDAVDTVLGMPRYVVRVRGANQGSPDTEKGPMEHLAEGHLTDDFGRPLIADLDDAPIGFIEKALDLLRGRAYNSSAGGLRRGRSVRVIR